MAELGLLSKPRINNDDFRPLHVLQRVPPLFKETQETKLLHQYCMRGTSMPLLAYR